MVHFLVKSITLKAAQSGLTADAVLAFATPNVSFLSKTSNTTVIK